MLSNKFFTHLSLVIFYLFRSILFHFLIEKIFVVLEPDSTYDSIQLAESKKGV